jgi:hypothetical protein
MKGVTLDIPHLVFLSSRKGKRSVRPGIQSVNPVAKRVEKQD